MEKLLGRVLLPPLAVFLFCIGLYLFLRGHNQVGGGFIGALCMTVGVLILSFIAFQSEQILRIWKIVLWGMIITGGLFFCLSFFLPLIGDFAPLKSLWLALEIPVLGKFGSVVLFDGGVFLVVAGGMALLFEAVLPKEGSS